MAGARTVCVTGAAGFVGSHVVKQLLEKGYTVRGTVRSLKDDSRVAHLRRLDAALPGHLELVEADLLNASSFDDALEGVSCVLHTASPFQIEVADPEADLIRPAVQGTEAVLRSAARHKATIKRVILTSSVAAVHGEYAAPPMSGKLYDEADWNETSSIENGQAYHLSKVLAEKRAVELAAEAGLKLVAILPNFVLGPPLSSRVDSLSVGFMKGLLEGKDAPSGTPCICDVRDVARAHVLAAELPLDQLESRYIVSHGAGLNPSIVSAVLSDQLPGVKVKSGADEATPDKIDGSRLRALGLELRSKYETVVDMASALIALKIVQLPAS